MEAGAKVAKQGAKVTRIVMKAEAVGDTETDSVGTNTAVAGWSMVDLLNEQTQHAMQITMAVGRA